MVANEETSPDTPVSVVNNLEGPAPNFFITNYVADVDWKKILDGVMGGIDTLVTEVNSVQSATDGIKASQHLLKYAGDIMTFSEVKELAEAIAPVFKWGQAIYGIVKKFTGGGELGAIKEKLKEILEELTKVEEAIRTGFEKLIAHDDAIYYRDKISSPAQILFDSLERHNKVLDKSVEDKFIHSCEEYHPVDILSRMYDFLKMADNGLMTQLIANKFGYQVYKDWVGMMRNDAMKCVIVQLYYDGVIMARDGTASAEDADYLAEKLKGLEDRFYEIDADRCIRFIECGEAARLFRTIATEIALREKDAFESTGVAPEMMKSIQQRWTEVNGPQPYSFHTFRGRMNVWEYSPRNDGCVRQADYKMYGRENRMVIVDNLFGKDHTNNEDYTFPDAPHKYKNNDNINILLIQPLTQEMLDGHANAVADGRNVAKINSIIDDFFHQKHVADINWECLQNLWPRFANEGISKPMVCLYTNQKGGSKSPSQNVRWGLNVNHSLSGGPKVRMDMSKMMESGFFSLDFTKGRRWERVGFLDQHFTLMGFSFIFM